MIKWTATVVDVKYEKDLINVVVSPDNFYPGGGGQPCDYGKIRNNNFEGEVFRIEKKDYSVLKVKPVSGKLKTNDIVECIVDEKRRKRLTQMHSGQHAFYKHLEIVKKIKGEEISVEKVDINEVESSLYVKASSLTWNDLFRAEDALNEMIKEGRPVYVHNIRKEEIPKYPELRIKTERIKSDVIRVVEIKDFDWSACSGTHVANLSEIKNFIVSRFRSAGNNEFEIKFRVDDSSYVAKLSQEIRVISSMVNEEPEKLGNYIKKIKDENERLKGQINELIKTAKIEFDSQRVGDITLYSKHLENFDNKRFVQIGNSALQEKSIVLVTNQEENLKYAVFCSPDSGRNAAEIIKRINIKLNGKGGGSNSFGMGAVNATREELLKEFMLIIS